MGYANFIAVVALCFACYFQQSTCLSVLPGTDPNPFPIDPIGPIDPIDFTKPFKIPRPLPFDICGIFARCICPSGQTYYTDSNGCRRCKCLPKCPQIKCEFASCPGGYIKDSNGCPTCRCRPVMCPDIACRLSDCPNGFETDSRGCNTCRCKPFECPRVLCPLQHICPFGRATDSKGCETCKCKGAPTTCPPMSCPGNLCLGGLEYDTDSNGCLINCRCKNVISPITQPGACSKIRCSLYCSDEVQFSREIKECGCDCGMAYIPVEPEILM